MESQTHRSHPPNPLDSPRPSRAQLWTGRVITVLVLLFLLFDGITKVLKFPQVLEASAKLGFPVASIAEIGVILLICTIVYVVPATSVWGTLLPTAYLGGAVCTQVRISGPLFDTLFPVGFCVLVWLGLVLRNPYLWTVLRPGGNRC